MVDCCFIEGRPFRDARLDAKGQVMVADRPIALHRAGRDAAQHFAPSAMSQKELPAVGD